MVTPSHAMQVEGPHTTVPLHLRSAFWLLHWLVSLLITGARQAQPDSSSELETEADPRGALTTNTQLCRDLGGRQTLAN